MGKDNFFYAGALTIWFLKKVVLLFRREPKSKRLVGRYLVLLQCSVAIDIFYLRHLKRGRCERIDFFCQKRTDGLRDEIRMFWYVVTVRFDKATWAMAVRDFVGDSKILHVQYTYYQCCVSPIKIFFTVFKIPPA